MGSRQCLSSVSGDNNHSPFSFCTVPVFKVHDRPIFNVAQFNRLTIMNVVSAMGLGFLLALLIFIDQNIVVSLTNAPENRYGPDTGLCTVTEPR